MRLFTLPIFAACALLAASAPAAVAATASHGHDVCIAEAVPVGSGVRSPMRCFTSFAAAVRAATNDRVNLPAGTDSESVTPGQLDRSPGGPNSRYVLSIDYRQTHYAGKPLIWYGPSKCGSFYANTMPAGWDNAVQSVRTYSGCANTLYSTKYFGQPDYKIHVGASIANLSSFDNQTSSQRWCSTYPCR